MIVRILTFLVLIVFLSCSSEEKSTSKTEIVDQVVVVENIRNLSIDIGGMTCEIGCAKLIESKLSKIKGIKQASVIFVDSIGKVSFDANKISKEEIINSIEKIADGELYTVKKVTEKE